MSEKFIPEEARATPDSEKSKEKPHLTQFNGREYDVEKLEEYAASSPEANMSLQDSEVLRDVTHSKYWKTKDGHMIGPSDLLTAFEENNKNWDEVKNKHPEWSVHIDKVVGVDYSMPGLVHDGHLIDGIHRLTKALAEKAEYFPVKVLEKLPKEAEYKENQ